MVRWRCKKNKWGTVLGHTHTLFVVRSGAGAPCFHTYRCQRSGAVGRRLTNPLPGPGHAQRGGNTPALPVFLGQEPGMLVKPPQDLAPGRGDGWGAWGGCLPCLSPCGCSWQGNCVACKCPHLGLPAAAAARSSRQSQRSVLPTTQTQCCRPR